MSDELTPARRPSSMARIHRWGILEVWLREHPGQREVRIFVATDELRVRVIDSVLGKQAELVIPAGEEPARVALRCLSILA